jgi:hypothetical protein
MADLVSIWRERCSHAKKTRVIKSLPIFTSLEKVEAQYLCSENGLMDMAFSKSENGPWTSLELHRSRQIETKSAMVHDLVILD